MVSPCATKQAAEQEAEDSDDEAPEAVSLGAAREQVQRQQQDITTALLRGKEKEREEARLKRKVCVRAVCCVLTSRLSQTFRPLDWA